MSTTKHTPGPWTWSLTPYADATDNDDAKVATVSVVNSVGVCRVADARLIAAAPDLLAACEALVLTTDCRRLGEGLCNRCNAQTAIKRARGGV